MNINVKSTIQSTFSKFHWGGTKWSFKNDSFEKKSSKNCRQIVSYIPHFSQTVEFTGNNYLIFLMRSISSSNTAECDVFEINVLDEKQKLLYEKKQHHRVVSEKGDINQVASILQSCKYLNLVTQKPPVKLMIEKNL